MNKRNGDAVLAQSNVALASLVAQAKKENVTLIRYNPATGEAWKIKPDGTIRPYKVVDKTNWRKVKAMTEAEIEALAEEDDSLPVDWLEHATVAKKPVVSAANGKR